MKRMLSLFLVLSFILISGSPGFALAEEFDTQITETQETQTPLGEETPEAQENVSAPVIKSAWIMNGQSLELSGTDDSLDINSQFLPSGQFEVSKKISVCSIISDANGITDLDQFASEMYYPMVGFGQLPEIGCGQKKGESCSMTQLLKADGISLFCDKIQNNNTNLPFFYDVNGFSNLCGTEGELEKDLAVVYCCDRDLAYNDVAGEYKVLISGKDKQAIDSNVFEAKFNYLELTAFEADFSSLNYGEVVKNSKKTIGGDLIWNNPKQENQTTIRNVGNTRAKITISQNDMGLGKTDGIWNIRYGAQLGQDMEWQNYWPEETATLSKALELSSMDQLSFSLEVSAFPEDETSIYAGKMNLDAQKEEYTACSI